MKVIPRKDFPPRWIVVLLSSSLLVFNSCSEKNQSRDRRPGRAEYSAVLSSETRQAQALEGETIEIPLRVKNSGRKEWSSLEANPCWLSYHLLDDQGKILKFDNPRTPLPRVIPPGEEAEVSVRVKAPLEKAEYQLEFDLVREGLFWFKDLGSATLVVRFLVEEQKWPDGRATRFSSSVSEFNTLQKLIRLTLNHDTAEFQGKSGKINGFTAGVGYPQIWLRDAATIIPASRFYYPEAFLTSWLQEHLAFQRPDGALLDWIDAQGRSDKNTVETDQEASAIQSAYQVFTFMGPGWLEKVIEGEALIDRLERALHYIFKDRFDEKTGLIIGAHTADWGDVESEDSDQRAIYVGENTRWTADIYDQSMAYEACRELADMFSALKRREKAAFWRKKASSLRDNAERWLWQKDKGFYRVHLHLDPWTHDFDEGDMFALGGNAQAILSGLADAEKAGRIIENALDRQKRFHISTLSGALLPPYPGGFFKHPAMDEEYEYQNGGQWDWFGGRLIYVMFENGFSAVAREKLIEIIQKNMANGGLFEWDTREGAGRGSDYYGGSAGSLAKALFEGYFGFQLGEKTLNLEPKLGEDEARVHLSIPAAGIFAAYEYQPLRAEKKIIFRYQSNVPYSGKVKMLVPWALLGLPGKESGARNLEVLRDGAEVPYDWSSLRQDDFIVLETDFKDHVLEIRASGNS